MACGPVARSVFLRCRVASVPVTLAGRVSVSKPCGVRSVPAYRRLARFRSPVLTGAGEGAAGAGVTEAGCGFEAAGAGEPADAPPPPPPQAARVVRLNRTRRFRTFILFTVSLRPTYLLGPAAEHGHLRERSTVGRCARTHELPPAIRWTARQGAFPTKVYGPPEVKLSRRM